MSRLNDFIPDYSDISNALSLINPCFKTITPVPHSEVLKTKKNNFEISICVFADERTNEYVIEERRLKIKQHRYDRNKHTSGEAAMKYIEDLESQEG